MGIKTREIMIFGHMSRFTERDYTDVEQKPLGRHQLWRHKRRGM